MMVVGKWNHPLKAKPTADAQHCQQPGSRLHALDVMHFFNTMRVCALASMFLSIASLFLC